MNCAKLWDGWLFVVGCTLVVFGLSLAFFNQTSLFDWAFNRQIDAVFWPGKLPAGGAVPFQAWIYGVLGCTVAGWGVFVAFLARHPFRKRERWARNCLCLGFALWYVTDTAISLRFGVVFNALFNTGLAAAVSVPLGATWTQFSAPE